MVQLEIRINGEWREVIRYDCAHNYTHKDCMNLKWEDRKMRLFLNYDDALTLADDDLNENWEYYKDRFLKGEFPC